MNARNTLDARSCRLRMPRAGKFCRVQNCCAEPLKSPLPVIPKSIFRRLMTSMELIMEPSNSNSQTLLPPQELAALATGYKESKLKLSLETRNCGSVVIVHCQGRIVYRDEATELSRVVGEILDRGGRVVLDLSGVSVIDSAGIGELVYLHTWAQGRQAEMKYAGASPFINNVFHLMNLNSVLDIHSDVCEALAAFQPGEVCADC